MGSAASQRARPAAKKARATQAQADAKRGAPSRETPAAARLGGGGRPLPPTTRDRMERAFGRSFAEVRVHAGPGAAALAGEHGAEAITTGNDIAFGEGRYRPGTEAGDRVIAHELAHVVQGEGAGGVAAGAAREVSSPIEPAEQEAEAAADRVVRGEAAGIRPGSRAPTTRERIMRRALSGVGIEPTVAVPVTTVSLQGLEAPAGGSDEDAKARVDTEGDAQAGTAQDSRSAAQPAAAAGGAAATPPVPAAPQAEPRAAGARREQGPEEEAAEGGGGGEGEREGEAPEEEGGEGGEELGAEIEPPPVPRLGGVEPARVGPPPRYAPPQLRQIRQRTGLEPAEHHARVRRKLEQVAEQAGREQRDIVEHVELTTAEVRGRLEAQAATIPDHIGGAIGWVQAAYAEARDQVSMAADGALLTIDQSATDSDKQVDEAALSSAEAVQNAITSSSPAVQALYEEIMVPIRELLRTRADRMTGTGEDKAESMVLEGETVAAIEGLEGADAIETAQNEARSAAVPPLARQAAADILQAGRDGAADVLAQETSLSTSFLLMVNPAAVHVEQTGTEDEQTMTSRAGEVHMRIASDYERARRFVELTRERTLEQLRQGERAAVQQIRQAGRRVEEMAPVRIGQLESGMLSAAAPFADAWRDQMARINRMIPAEGFINARQVEPRLAASEKELEALAASQREQFAEQAAESEAQTAEGLEEDLAGLRSAAWSSVQSARTTSNEQSDAINQIASNFADGFRGVAEPACSLAGEFATEVEEKLGMAPDDVRRQMEDLRAQTETTLDGMITSFGTRLDEQIWALHERLLPQLDTVSAQVIDDLADRAGRAYRAMDYTWGTDESALFNALRGMSAKRGAALAQYWTDTGHGNSLEWWLRDELSGDEKRAALAYLAGNRALGARYELAASMHWYGDDEAQIETALRGLTPEDVQELQNTAGFEEVHRDLQDNLDGSDLQVTEALIGGRVARADAIRLRDRIDEARRGEDADALHDALASVDPSRLSEVRREFAHLQSGGGLDTVPTVEDAAATDVFVEYITRDIEVYEPGDPEGGGGRTRTLSLTGPSRDLAVALATHGEGSPQARAARLAFEYNRGGEPRMDRLQTALDDPELRAARANPDLQSENPHARRRAEQRLSAVEGRRTQMEQEFARLRGADDATVSDPGASRAFTEAAMRGMFSLDPLGQRLGLSMLRDGRANPALAIRYAVRGSGTNEELIRRTLRGMTPAEIERLKQDYTTEFGGGPDALFEDLGVFGHGGFFTELSGDERQEVEVLLMGVPQNDRDRWRLARLKDEHQRGEGTTWATRGHMAGTIPGRALAMNREEMDRMIAAAGGEENAFDEHGNFVGVPGQYDRNDFRVRAAAVGEMAENYKAHLDSLADLITGAIAVIGAVVGGIVVTVLTAGTAGPLVVAAWAAGIAAATGAASMAANYAIKGGRYGWEQAGIDAALTLLDAATAGVSAGAGAKAARAAQALAKVRAAARTPAQVALAGRLTQQQARRELVRGFGRSAVTAGVSGAARTGTQDGVWDEGVLTGLGRVIGGGVRSAFVGVVTHGASTAFRHSGLGQRLGNSTGYLTRGFGEGVASGIGGMAGRSAEIGLDVLSGTHHGEWYEALGSIAAAGGREFLQNFGQGMAEVPKARRDAAQARADEAAAQADAARIARQGPGPQDQAADASFRMAALRAARAEDPTINPRAFLRQLDEAVASDRAAAEAQRQQQRALRRELLSAIPPERRGEFADVPIRVLSDEDFERFTGSRRGLAVTIFVEGEPQILMRRSASPEVLREEGIHLVQSRDPRWRDRVAQLDEAHLARWHELDVEAQIALYRNKVEIEIDAQEELRRGLQAELDRARSPESRAALERRINAAEAGLSALRARLGEVNEISPDRIRAIRAGDEGRPQYLDQPPRLFGKHDRDLTVPELNPAPGLARKTPLNHGDPNLDAEPRRPVALENTTFEDDYPGHRVYQVGDYWQEPETYRTPGGQRATRDRWYRMVEVVDAEGRVVDRRREILQIDAAPRWQQRGSESTMRGRIHEEASRLQTMDQARRRAGGAIDPATSPVVPIGALRGPDGRPLSAQHGGGAGFDDVVINFRQAGDQVVADIVIVEAKGYRRDLALGDFSAITGNLRKNIYELDAALRRSNLPPERLEAARRALGNWAIRFEVHVGAETGLGSVRSGRILSSVKDIAAAWRRLDVVALESMGRISDGDRQRLHTLRQNMESALNAEPFNARAARAAVKDALEGARAIGRAYGVPADNWRPAIGAPVKVHDDFIHQAEQLQIGRHRLAGRPLGYALGAAEDMSLATRPYRPLSADLPPQTRLVQDHQNRVIALTSPDTAGAAAGPHSPASRHLVDLLRGRITSPDGAPPRPDHVLWSAAHAPPADVGRVLRQVHAELAGHPDDLARLRVLVPRSAAGDADALQGMLGMPGALDIVPQGDHYVVSFKRPDAAAAPVPGSAPARAPEAASAPAPAPARAPEAASAPDPAAPRVTGADPEAAQRRVQAEAEADAVYARLRAEPPPPGRLPAEVATVAGNSRLPVEILALVYQHVFLRTHELAIGPGQTVSKRFDPDSDIGRLWAAANRGPLDDDDRAAFVRLMAHEYIEGRLMEMGMPYQSSHPEAWEGGRRRPTPRHFGAHDVAPDPDVMRAAFGHLDGPRLALGRGDLDLPETPTIRDLDGIVDRIVQRIAGPDGPYEVVTDPSGARVLRPRGEALATLYHGAAESAVASIRRSIRVDVNSPDKARSTQWGPGFYLATARKDADHYAEMSSRPTKDRKEPERPAVVAFHDVPVSKLGTVLDVTQGPGAAAWEKFLDQPLMPGLPDLPNFPNKRRAAWERSAESRGDMFLQFLKEQNLDPDVVIAPHDMGEPQIVIRTKRAAEALQAYIEPEVPATPPRITGAEAGDDRPQPAAGRAPATLYHGAAASSVPSIRRQIRTDVNSPDKARSTQWGPGFYLATARKDADHYAEMASQPTKDRAADTPAVVAFHDVPVSKLGTVLDVTQGPGAAAWEKFLDQPLMPGLPDLPHFPNKRRAAWERSAESRGDMFLQFLKEQNLDPDVVIAPHDMGEPQIIIRTKRAAEALQAHIEPEVPATPPRITGAKPDDDRPRPTAAAPPERPPGEVTQRPAPTGTLPAPLSHKLNADGSLPDAEWLDTAGEWGVVGRRGNVLRLAPGDWDHILEGHVSSTFNPAARTGKAVSTVFTGTPQQYAQLLEEALKSRAVIVKMTEAVRSGARSVDIPVIVRGQSMVIKVDVATSSIKSFYANGAIRNPRLFVQR